MNSDKDEHYITGVVKVKTYKRTWKIQNFDLVIDCDELINAQTMKIEIVQAAGSKYIFLIGLRRHSPTEVYMFCQLCKTSGIIKSEVHAHFRTVVRNKHGGTFRTEKTVQTYNVNTPSGTNKTHLLVYDSEMKDPNLLQAHKTIVIDVDLTLVLRWKYASDLLKQLELESHNQLRQNFLNLMIIGYCSDVTIVTMDKVEFPAHKIILRAQNPVFAAMLQSGSLVVDVPDITGDTMEILLLYLYTGKLLPSWSNPDVIVDFTYAAGKFQLLNVLNMLDQRLGDQDSHKYSGCYQLLLKMAKNMSLKNAEKKLSEKISMLTATTQAFIMMIDYWFSGLDFESRQL